MIRRYNNIRLIIFALIILLIGVSLGYYLTSVIHRSYYGVPLKFIAFAVDKLPYFKNTTGLHAAFGLGSPELGKLKG